MSGQVTTNAVDVVTVGVEGVAGAAVVLLLRDAPAHGGIT